MKIKTVTVGFLQTNCYIVEDSYNNSDYVMVIDPGESIERIQELVPGPVTHIVLTHAHFDHIGALEALRKAYPEAELYISEKEDYSPEHLEYVIRKVLGRYADSTHFLKRDVVEIKPDVLLKDGDRLLNFRVIHTPGHTAGSICLYNEENKVLFSGDTLFAYSCGRCDIDGNERDMVESLKKIMALDEETVVYPGHEQTSTIGSIKNYIN